MNLIQSYYSTIMRGKFSLYEIRVLVKIVENVQDFRKGGKVAQYIGAPLCLDEVNYNFAISCKEVLSSGSHHYEDVREACSSLADKDVTWWSSSRKEWRKSSIIYNVRLNSAAGVVQFSAAKWLIDLILDFTAGFSKYELSSAMSLKSANSVRLYMLTASLSRPVYLRIEFLRTMLGCEGMYAQTRDFIKRVIEPASQELERENVNGFSYSIHKTRGKIDTLLFNPVKREKKTRAELTAQAGLSTWCPDLLQKYLMLSCQFTARELSANKDTLFRFSKLPDWLDRLQVVIERQRRGRYTKGYVIGALKSIIKEEGKR